MPVDITQFSTRTSDHQRLAQGVQPRRSVPLPEALPDKVVDKTLYEHLPVRRPDPATLRDEEHHGRGGGAHRLGRLQDVHHPGRAQAQDQDQPSRPATNADPAVSGFDVDAAHRLWPGIQIRKENLAAAPRCVELELPVVADLGAEFRRAVE